jgi:hypothetical protein
MRLEYSTVCNCTPEHIWQAFQHVERWPKWSSVIANTQWIEGQPWVRGSKFQMQILQPIPVTFRPEVIDCAAPGYVHWIGKTTALNAEQWFTFEGQSDGTTVMKTVQDFTGPASFMFGESVKTAITNIYVDLFRSLKEEAEKNARPTSPDSAQL